MKTSNAGSRWELGVQQVRITRLDICYILLYNLDIIYILLHRGGKAIEFHGL